MAAVSPVILVAWIALIPILFSCMNKQRAVLIALVAGWLFLPEVQLDSSWEEVPVPIQIPPFFLTKTSAICYGLLIAIFAFDSARLQTFRFRWFDVPTIAWCLSPLLSTESNGLKI